MARVCQYNHVSVEGTANAFYRGFGRQTGPFMVGTLCTSQA